MKQNNIRQQLFLLVSFLRLNVMILTKRLLPWLYINEIALDFIVIPRFCSSSRLSMYLSYCQQEKKELLNILHHCIFF